MSWKPVFTREGNNRAVRDKGGLICILTKVRRYPNQDERYEQELEESRKKQHLIAAAPEMLEALQFIYDQIDWKMKPFIVRVVAKDKIENAINKAISK